MTKFDDFLKIEVLKEMPTKISNIKKKKKENSEIILVGTSFITSIFKKSTNFVIFSHDQDCVLGRRWLRIPSVDRYHFLPDP